MTQIRFIIFAIAAAGLIGGCSKAVKHKVMEVKTREPGLKTAVIQKQPVRETIDPRAFHHYVNGLLYEELGELPKAAGSFRSALKYHPDSYELRYSLAETYYRLRQYEQTLDLLTGIEPEDENVYFLRAATYSEVGMSDSAKSAYLNLVRLDERNSMAYSHLASYYRSVGDVDSLIWAYDKLAHLRPDNERIWRELGRLQAQTGLYDDAKNSFKRSLEVRDDATNILSYLALAEVYLIGEDDDSAKIAYEQALDIEPYNAVANRELATIFVRQDSLAEAVTHARRVVEISPLDRNAVRRLAVLYFSLDSLQTADSIFTYLVESGERNSVNHYYLGRIGVIQENYARAVDEFTILTQLADSVFESWLDLGYAYGKLGDREKEILTYKTGLNHVTDEAGEKKLLFALGAAYEQDNKIDDAVALFEEIIAKSPNHSAALNYLGYMLADRGERLEYARDLIEKAVKISPDNAAYLDSYGWVFYRLEEFEQALEYLKKAVALDSDPVIFDHLGDAYDATGDADSARIWWQKALELQPENEEIRQKLGN